MLIRLKFPHMKFQVKHVWPQIFTPCHRHLSQQPKKLDHLTLTADQFRQMKIHRAEVIKIEDLSKTVRSLTLGVSEPGFTFKAGQWVDFFIPNVDTVLGLTVTSAPHMAEQHGIVDLAVRYTDYPPTKWIHTECKIGQEVAIRVGGEFYYDPENNDPDPRSNLLMIGGGVGINPMVSIARHFVHVATTGNINIRKKLRGLKLYYTVKTVDELVFHDVFRKLSQDYPRIQCNFYVTREEKPSQLDERTWDINYRRISEDDIQKALAELKPEPVVSYVCGPNKMIDRASKVLYSLGMLPERVKFEKWW